MTTQVLKYNEQEVEFEFNDANVMVNATQMAKIFGKEVKHFNENETTENFIQACLKSRNSDFLGVKTRDDLIISKQKSGTYMHRILALKFAAWLDPDFEVWVYMTIDYLLFDHYRQMEESMKNSAKRRNRLDTLKDNLRKNEDYIELERLELEERQASYSRGKHNRSQIDLFRGVEFNR